MKRSDADRRFVALLGLFLLLLPLHSTGQYSPSRAFSGTVKIKGQATLNQRVEVTLLTMDRRPAERVFADSLGNFQFMAVGPGAYILIIDVRGYRRIEERVEIVPRSLSLTQRQFVLEPVEDLLAGSKPGTISVEKNLVPAEARKAFERGEKELARRRYNEAAASLDQALAIAPDFAAALHARGLVCLQQGDSERAQNFFQKAVAAAPRLGDAHIGLGAALVRTGQFEGAIEPLTKGLSLNPASFLGSFERCRAYMNLNRLHEAEQDCKHARELAKDDLSLNVLLGNLYLRQGREREALAEFELYLHRDSESPTAAAIRDVVQKLRKTESKPPH